MAKKGGILMLRYRVIVDKRKCTGIGECELVCPVDVFDIINDLAVPTREPECIGCMSCVEVCPNQAIDVFFNDELFSD